MKLRGLDRVLLFIGAFLVAAIGVSMFLISLRMSSFILPTFDGGNFVISKFIVIICGAFLFLFAVYILSITIGSHKKKTEFVVQETAGGELRISINALDSMVRNVMSTHGDMSLKDMSVENIKDNVFVNLKISIAKNVSIPLAVASVQKDIRQHLLGSTGIDVKEVRVSVDTTEEAVESSPFIMHETIPVLVPEVIDQDKEQDKKHKHGLFSKKSTVVEKASLLPDNSAEQEEVTDYSALDTIEDRKDEGMDNHAGT